MQPGQPAPFQGKKAAQHHEQDESEVEQDDQVGGDCIQHSEARCQNPEIQAVHAQFRTQPGHQCPQLVDFSFKPGHLGFQGGNLTQRNVAR